MPRVRRGPNGPKRRTAGVSGTNKRTPMGGAKGSPPTRGLTPRTRGRYGGKSSRGGY